MKMALTLGLGYSPIRGFHLRAEQPDLSTEIEAVQRRLRARPDHAGLHRRLGDLHAESGDGERARESYRRAAALYGKQRRPGRRRFVELGETLLYLGELPEAEARLRQAVKEWPGEWAAWATLARVLSARVERLASGGQLLPARTEEAQGLLDEARRCYGRAVAADPGEYRPYALRGTFRAWTEGRLQDALAAAREGRPGSPPPLMPREAVEDFEAAARLAPRDPYATAVAAWYGFMHQSIRNGRYGGPTAEAWRSFSEEQKRPVREAIARLQEMAKTRRPRAAAALTALGFLQYETFEPENIARAQTNLRRAMRLDPSRPEAAEMLIHTFAVEGDHAGLAALARDLLERKESARFRMIAAYALWKTSRLEEAEGQLRAGLLLEPRDAAFRMALAAVLLKRGGDRDALAEAGWLLHSAGSELVETAPLYQRSEHAVLYGLYLALTGAVAEARRELERALSLNGTARRAREALVLLQQER